MLEQGKISIISSVAIRMIIGFYGRGWMVSISRLAIANTTAKM